MPPFSVRKYWVRKMTQKCRYKSLYLCRDIKGANLLVDVNGVVKLADFGMAKHLSTVAPNLSLKGVPWMAPEVVQATLVKDVSYGLAVDIWSVGCTIIEVFTGKPPWSGLEGVII
jgi:serine/threonine protein kinase